MNCKKIRELLLTDYLDAQADVKVKAQVQKHLGACAECRRFEEEVRLIAVSAFKNAAKPEVPESVWFNIKGRIDARESPGMSLLDIIRDKLKVFSSPQPALAFASTAFVLLIMFVALSRYNAGKNQVKEYFRQQIDFYSMLNAGEENGNHTGELGADYFYSD